MKNREKVWAAFHSRLIEELPQLTAAMDRQLASTLAFHLAKCLVDKNFCQTNTPAISIPSLTTEENDILEYIAGYILFKFKHVSFCNILHATHSVSSKLIDAKDRGALIYPVSDFVLIIKELEICFREFSLMSLEKNAFLISVYDKGISDHFDSLFDVETGRLFEDMCRLFYVLRIHQKCRNFVEKYSMSTKSTRKSKPLRDTV